MSYYVPLASVSLETFKERLQSFRLLPSQQILLENLDRHFLALAEDGIENLEQLQIALKGKTELEKMANRLNIPSRYLTVLRREINSYHPKKRMIADMPLVEEKTKKALASLGVKTTADLYPHVQTAARREELCRKTGLSEKEARYLGKITDVCRLRYVNEGFAMLLCESPFDTMEKIKTADPDELFRELKRINDTRNLYSGRFSPNDAEYIVKDPVNVTFDMEF